MPKNRKHSKSPDRGMNSAYNIPDTSKGDFYCALCDARMNCLQMWESHKIGKRHVTNMKKKPGEAPSKVKAVRVDDVPLIYDLLNEETEPIVGLDFVCENRRADAGVGAFYNCYLCQATCPTMSIMDHLVSMKHRLAYLKKVDPKNTQILEDFRLPKSQFEPMVRDQCQDKEDELGRGTMEIKLEKSHGQIIQGGRLKTKIAPLPMARPPIKSDCQEPDRWNYPSSNHFDPYDTSESRYDKPSTSRYDGPPPPPMIQYPVVPFGPGPPPFGRFELPYGLPPPPICYPPNPFPPIGPMDIPPNAGKVKSEKFAENTQSSSKVRTVNPKPRKHSPEHTEDEDGDSSDEEPPKAPTPEPEFEFNFKDHWQHLTPHHVQALIDSVFDDATNNSEAFERESVKFDLLAQCLNLKLAAVVKVSCDNATAAQKKVYEAKFSDRGEKDRERRKLEAYRIPGYSSF